MGASGGRGAIGRPKILTSVHRIVSDLLTAGNDISAVLRMARHASMTTTQRYDRCGEEIMRRAADTPHFPVPRSGA